MRIVVVVLCFQIGVCSRRSLTPSSIKGGGLADWIPIIQVTSVYRPVLQKFDENADKCHI